MRSVAREIGEILSTEIARLGFDPAPADAWAHGVVGMVHLSTDWWLQGGNMPREQLVTYLVGLLSHGFFGLADNATLARRSGLTP
jgi:tetracycline repressor-like protein